VFFSFTPASLSLHQIRLCCCYLTKPVYWAKVALSVSSRHWKHESTPLIQRVNLWIARSVFRSIESVSSSIFRLPCQHRLKNVIRSADGSAENFGHHANIHGIFVDSVLCIAEAIRDHRAGKGSTVQRALVGMSCVDTLASSAWFLSSS
jgi:hypothetical protein